MRRKLLLWKSNSPPRNLRKCQSGLTLGTVESGSLCSVQKVASRRHGKITFGRVFNQGACMMFARSSRVSSTLNGPWGKFPDHYEVRRQLLHIFSSSEEQQSVLDMLVYNMMAWGDRIKNLNGFSDDPKNILFKFSLYDVVTFLRSLRPVRSYVTYSTT